MSECGGMMYLTGGLYTGTKENSKHSSMCGVFPDAFSRMTPHMKMHYAVIEFTAENSQRLNYCCDSKGGYSVA